MSAFIYIIKKIINKLLNVLQNRCIFFKQLKKFSVDFANKLGSGQQAVDQAIEKTTNNVKWRSENEEVVYNWLQQTLNEINES